MLRICCPLATTRGCIGTWRPSLQLDQVIGTGVLWVLGEVLGVPFLIVLIRSMRSDDTARAVEVDAELDRLEESEPAAKGQSTLWWQHDPQLRERFNRR